MLVERLGARVARRIPPGMRSGRLRIDRIDYRRPPEAVSDVALRPSEAARGAPGRRLPYGYRWM